MTMITETNATIMVGDMERSVDFYTNVLGLKLKARYGNQFAQITAPRTIIALHPRTEKESQSRSSPSVSIGFAVDDLDHSMEELRSKGVQFFNTSDDTQVKLAFFTDPDGNPLYLSQSKWR